MSRSGTRPAALSSSPRRHRGRKRRWNRPRPDHRPLGPFSDVCGRFRSECGRDRPLTFRFSDRAGTSRTADGRAARPRHVRRRPARHARSAPRRGTAGVERHEGLLGRHPPRGRERGVERSEPLLLVPRDPRRRDRGRVRLAAHGDARRPSRAHPVPQAPPARVAEPGRAPPRAVRSSRCALRPADRCRSETRSNGGRGCASSPGR